MPKYTGPQITVDPLNIDDFSVEKIQHAYDQDQFKAWRQDLVRVETPTVSQAAPFILDFPDYDTYLWRYLSVALQDFHKDPNYKWRPQYQKRGTCVGMGFKLGVDIVMAVNYLLGLSDFLGRAAVSSIYAGSRVDIGGQPGRWDGSTGSWASKWLVEYGVVLLHELNLADDSRDPDENLGLQWCASRNGVPVEWENVAKEKPVTRRLLVTTAREAGKSIQSGCPVANCSNLIPTGQRDSNGYSPARRSGGHCTLFSAVRYEPFGLLYQNSWSEKWGSGGVFPNDQPPGSVWVTERDADAILSQGDSYALIGVSGLGEVPNDLRL